MSNLVAGLLPKQREVGIRPLKRNLAKDDERSGTFHDVKLLVTCPGSGGKTITRSRSNDGSNSESPRTYLVIFLKRCRTGAMPYSPSILRCRSRYPTKIKSMAAPNQRSGC